MRRTFGLLHLRQLRRQPLRALLAVIAIGAGVTLSVAVVIARSSLDYSFAAYSEGLAGAAPLRVSSSYDHGSIDTSTLAAVEHADGVQAVVPLVLSVGQVRDSDGADHLIAIIGADCRAQDLFGASGCDAAALAQRTADDPPLIGRGLHDIAGADAILRTDNGDRALRDAPVVSDLDRLNRGLVVMYPLPIAQQLFGRPGGLDAIFVIPRPGVGVDTLQARLEGLVGPQNKVTSASETSDSVRFVSAQILPFLLLISLFGLAVGAQLVYNTMTLSLEERRRELAVASAVGSTPNMVLGGVLAEAAVLGALGGIVGVVMGALVSRPFISTLSRYAEQAAGIHLQVHVTAPNLVLGLSMGVLASMLAAIVPARRAARLDIAGELAARGRRADAAPAVRARRAIVLVSLTLGGLAAAWLSSRDGALEPWQPNVMLAGVLIAFVCGFALPPALAPFALRLIARVPVLNRGPARVAMGTLVSETRRTSAVFMAVGAAVGMSFTLGSVLPGMAFGAEQLTQQTAYDRVMVTTLEPNNNSGVDAKLSPALQAALGDVPGVEGVEHVYHATADLAGVGSVGLSADDGWQRRYPLLRGVDATEAIARGDVMIGPALARDLSLRPGDSLDLPGRFGTVRMTVGGIWQAPDQLGRSITVPAATFVALVGPRPPDWVLLRPAPGVSPVELARRVRDLRLADNLRIFDPAALSIEYAANFEEFVKPFEVLSRGLLAVTFIATVSTLLLASVQRRREHGLLAAVGMPPGDLGRMVLVEAGMIGLLGTLLGGLSGLVGLEGFAISSATLTGLDIPFRLSIAPLLVYGSIVTACVLAGAALPAWRTSRLDPVVALRQE